jgi:beta-galactosidase/beta-glucuronidase
MGGQPRPEYPRPQLRRPEWTNLNGSWAFAFDDGDVGVARRWQDTDAAALRTPGTPWDRVITVPFCYQSTLSGIGETALHDVVWYARTCDHPAAGGSAPGGPAAGERDEADPRVLLHFGAVDYRATVWVNGTWVAWHEGGHTPFTADVTHALRARDNVLVVRAEDPAADLTIPRGKQYWKETPEDIYYTPTTGIWQTVWLEVVPAVRVDHLRLTPDVDRASVTVETTVAAPGQALERGWSVRLVGFLGDDVVFDDRLALQGELTCRRTVPLVGRRFPPQRGASRRLRAALWSPERPNLYDLRVELCDPSGRVVDTVESYFGLRKIEVRDGRVHLNNRPYYQRLVLDQGYFPDGLLTAPTDDDLREDVQRAKELGFNGARKHQKVEDPRWLYWADRLGLLVWAEMANAYQYTAEYVARMTAEWQAAVRRDYNHPSVVAWVPVNESWGVPQLEAEPEQVEHLLALYHLTRSLDTTRLVVSNDGWEHARSDMLTLHDYGPPKSLRTRYGSAESAVRAKPADRPAYVPGRGHGGEPLLITEFGGVALESDSDGHRWGYSGAKDADALVARYADLVGALLAHDTVQGFCYTQLTDVQQEVNGLLTADRRPKADPHRIRRITRGDPRA